MEPGDIDSVNHVGIAVRDMDKAVACYEALGFTLSPLSVHSGSRAPGEPVQPMATGNRCAIFPHNYIEVLGIVNPGRLDWSWGDFIKRFQGAQIICFGCKDAEVVNRRVRANEIETSNVIALQRDIETLEGVRTARFDCVHFDRKITPEGLIQAARHRNPEYLHQQRYLGHRNGATALADVVLVFDDPQDVARRYERLTGRKAVESDGIWDIGLPLVSRLRFMSPQRVSAEFAGTLFPPFPSIAALGFKVANVDRTEGLLDGAGFTTVRSGKRVAVPAEEALGAIHYFF